VNPEQDHCTCDIDLPFSISHIGICKLTTLYLSPLTKQRFEIDTRILLTLLLDKSARPSPKDMKLWVDVLRFTKRGATGGAFGFFTYMELSQISNFCGFLHAL